MSSPWVLESFPTQSEHGPLHYLEAGLKDDQELKGNDTPHTPESPSIPYLEPFSMMLRELEPRKVVIISK